MAAAVSLGNFPALPEGTTAVSADLLVPGGSLDKMNYVGLSMIDQPGVVSDSWYGNFLMKT